MSTVPVIEHSRNSLVTPASFRCPRCRTFAPMVIVSPAWRCRFCDVRLIPCDLPGVRVDAAHAARNGQTVEAATRQMSQQRCLAHSADRLAPACDASLPS